MLNVGLSGGIGAGKSTVARTLQNLGAVVVDSDALAREVVAPGTQGLQAIEEAFGTGVLTASGALDRVMLAGIVFGDGAARARLNAIVHPLVRRRSVEIVQAAGPQSIVVHDIPLLVENGLAPTFPLTLMVDAAEEIRIRRLVAQRGMDLADVRSRVAAQATSEQRRAVADLWFDNSGAPVALERSVRAAWRRLVSFERNLRLGRAAPRPRRAVVVDADPEWGRAAERLIARLQTHVGSQAIRIDHIGSTSVPGLAAKDVIDVQIVVESIAVAESIADRLPPAGLVLRRGLRWDRVAGVEGAPKLFARNADPGRAANVHLRPVISPWWRDALLIREWLRAHPEEAASYEAHKRAIAATGVDTDAYAEAKTPWLIPALQRAGRWASSQTLEVPGS